MDLGLVLRASILVVLLQPGSSNGQESDSVDILLPSLIELLAESSDDLPVYSQEQWALWQEWLNTPLSINAATAGELATLPLVDVRCAQNIVRHRKRHGRLSRLQELLSIEDCQYLELPLLAPFVTAKPPSLPGTSRGSVATRVIRSSSNRSPHLYSRLRFKPSARLEVGASLEQDPGEQFGFRPSRGLYGFDHAAFFAHYQGTGIIEQLVLGHFIPSFGHGLVLGGNAYRPKGGGMALPLSRLDTRLHPYAGADESTSYSGVAIVLSPTRWIQTAVFVSRRRLDARLKDDEIESISTSGIHRTELEINRMGNQPLESAGGWVALHRSSIKVAALLYHARLSRPFASPSRPDLAFRVQHLAPYSWSIGASFKQPKWQMGAEWAGAYRQQPALVLGMQWKPNSFASALLHARHYPPNWFQLASNGFSEQSSLRNEAGLYAELALRPSPFTRLTLFADQYRYYWLSYLMHRPIRGAEFGSRILIRFDPGIQIVGQVRVERKDASFHLTTASPPLRTTTPSHFLQWRLEGHLHPRDFLRVRVRMEHHDRRKATDIGKGFLLFHDIRVGKENRTTAHLRSTFFSRRGAGSFYVFENDLRYRFSIRGLSGNGQRHYLKISLPFGERVVLEGKASLTIRTITPSDPAHPIKRVRSTEWAFQMMAKL